MRISLLTGITFGLTSAIITTLGLMVGLHSGTHSQTAVMDGILMIAIADSFADALGIHISEKAKNRMIKEVWVSTVTTFIAKFLFALTFFVPVLLLSLSTAMIVSLIWGLSVLTILSYAIAKYQGKTPWIVVGEHILIALVVIFITHRLGDWIGKL